MEYEVDGGAIMDARRELRLGYERPTSEKTKGRKAKCVSLLEGYLRYECRWTNSVQRFRSENPPDLSVR